MPSNIDLQKLLELYKSGRYECDVGFYEDLLLLVNELEVFEYIPSLQKNLQHVKRIHQITLQNSDSLNEQFDEQKAIQKTEEMKRQINLIDVPKVIEIISHIQKQGYKSYSQHCAQLIKKYNYHPKYVEIVKNIVNNVYDPKLKADNILISTLFMIRNTDKIDQILAIYDKAIQNGLILMKQIRKRLPQCQTLTENILQKINEYLQLEQEGNLQESGQQIMHKLISSELKIKQYCHGSVFIYVTLQKICDIAKILEQKNNMTLKLNSYKPDIEATLNLLKKIDSSNNDLQSVEARMSDLPIHQLKGMFLGEKEGVDKINRCCRICLRFVAKQDGLNGSGDYHKVCQQVVKLLMVNNDEKIKQ